MNASAAATGQEAWPEDAIAVLSMSCRLPLGDDADTYWENLCAATEAVRAFQVGELEAAGVARDTLNGKRFVNAGATIDGIELFDAAFFGFTPAEAEVLDPQQRVLLECAYHALERAGYADRRTTSRDIGVFVGVASSSYALENLFWNRAVVEAVGPMAILIANEKDFAATQIAYRLNLTGPAVNINTACSTSLVAIHHAIRSLRSYECDLALAGGATLRARQTTGYDYVEGGILSPDGHCRPFSANAKGTVDGNGAGVVLLKRLRDAIEAGDIIEAVILGSAVNNDGADKVGITAPSIAGQARVIHEALADAGVDASRVGYVECHGTGTVLGDPIEVAALKEAFRCADSPARAAQRCALGSVKSNMGHLDTAAGVAGFIKAALAVKHGKVPPSLHCEAPNPRIDFASSGFFVADTLQPWPRAGAQRIAGVSSFGIGGTNAHVVLASAPRIPCPPDAREPCLLMLSAKSAVSLRMAIERLRDRMRAAATSLEPHRLIDTAYTLSLRPAYSHRFAAVARTHEEAARRLDAALSDETSSSNANEQSCLADAQWLDSAGASWLQHRPVDLDQLFEAKQCRRVPLPGYCFDRKQFWIPPPAQVATDILPKPSESQETGGAHLNFATWNPHVVFSRQSGVRECRRLVYADLRGVARAIIGEAGAGIAAWIEQAAHFARDGAATFRLDPHDEEHHESLLESLEQTGVGFEVVECFLPLDLTTAGANASAASEAALLLDAQTAVLALTRAMAARWSESASIPLLRIYLPCAYQVTGRDDVSPAARSLAGMLAVINQELPGARVQIVDVERQPSLHAVRAVVAMLDEQLAAGDDEPLHAVRGCRYWRRSFARLDQLAATHTVDEDVVVLTGGLGNMGAAALRHLAAACRHLIVVGRRSPGSLDARSAAQLERARDINRNVRYVCADVGQPTFIEVLHRIAEQHGHISCLIHAAAVMDRQSIKGFAACQMEDLRQHHAAKVCGAVNILAAARSVRIEKVVLMSSLSATLGGLGFSAYASANAFMDGIAERSTGEPSDAGPRVFAIGWDGLGSTGTATDTTSATRLIDAAEMIDVLFRTVHQLQPGAYVYARGDLQARWARSIVKLGRIAASTPEPEAGNRHSGADVDAVLADIYRQLIGVEPTAHSENFFEMGGDSLSATQLCLLVRQKLAVDLPLEAVFDTPEVSRLAAVIRNTRCRQSSQEVRMAELLSEVEEMDEEQLEALLRQ